MGDSFNLPHKAENISDEDNENIRLLSTMHVKRYMLWLKNKGILLGIFASNKDGVDSGANGRIMSGHAILEGQS